MYVYIYIGPADAGGNAQGAGGADGVAAPNSDNACAQRSGDFLRVQESAGAARVREEFVRVARVAPRACLAPACYGQAAQNRRAGAAACWRWQVADICA